MPLLARTTLAAAVGLAIGWSSVRWIAGSSPKPGRAAPGGKEENAAAAATPGRAATTASERMETIATLYDQPATMARDHAVAAALLKLEAADFPAGAEAMKKLFQRLQEPFGSQAQELAEAWMDRWLEIDPPGALRFLSSSPFLAELPVSKMEGWPIAERARSAHGGIFAALARRQPEWLRQTLADVKPGPEREVGIYVLLTEAAKGDPAPSRQLLASFADGD